MPRSLRAFTRRTRPTAQLAWRIFRRALAIVRRTTRGKLTVGQQPKDREARRSAPPSGWTATPFAPSECYRFAEPQSRPEVCLHLHRRWPQEAGAEAMRPWTLGVLGLF